MMGNMSALSPTFQYCFDIVTLSLIADSLAHIVMIYYISLAHLQIHPPHTNRVGG